MSIWDDANFDFKDSLNQTIWTESVKRQRAIAGPRKLLEVGAVGAQQAMLAKYPEFKTKVDTVLPWVPDLVGSKWNEGGGVMIIGSAYAGFIKQFSGRSASMCLCRYSLAKTVVDFQKAFLETVIRPDKAYYGKIESLVRDLSLTGKILLTDLCRASFVKRGVADPTTFKRKDGSGDPVDKKTKEMFQNYLAHNEDWTWSRLVDKNTHCLVALGSTAHDGLIRLFQHKHCNYKITKSKRWEITGKVDGVDKKWCLLKVRHPCDRDNNSGYGRGIREDLKRMLNHC